MLTNTGGAYSSVQSTPTHFAEATFHAESGQTYYVWVRGVASTVSTDAIWLQFDQSITTGGSAVYRIGSNKAALYNGFGALPSPGWIGGDAGNNNANIAPIAVRFQGSGTQTLRITSRQAPMRFDEVWISPTQATRPVPQTSARLKDPAPPPPPPDDVPGWPIPDWEVAEDPASVGLSAQRLEEYRSWLASRAAGQPYATVIVRGGKIGYEHYADGATASSAWEIGSIRKSVASGLLGMALAEGRLSLDTVVYNVWPDIYTITGATKDMRIQMRQLANATSGWRSTAEPGAQWQYNNLAFTAGHAVIGRVYGLAEDKVAPMVEERIKNPIGASGWRVYHFTNDWYSNPGPKLAIDSNLRDLARFGYLWLRGGEWNGQQLVPKDFVREATRNQSLEYGRHYGYWWFTNDSQALLPDAPPDVFYHIGFGTGDRRTVLIVCPSLDLVAAVSTHRTTFDIGADYLQTPVATVNAWLAQIVRAIGNSDPPPPPPSTTLYSDSFDRADSSVIGNGWTEVESASTVILANAGVSFQALDDPLRPMIRTSFAPPAARVLTWSFDIDFKRTGTEKTYSFWMQFGDSSLMNDAAPQVSGVAVNLAWGGPNHGLEVHESLGYVVGGVARRVATLSGPNKVEVRIDRDAGTYTVTVAGQSSGPVAYDKSLNLDTVRFFADALHMNSFSSRRIDNVAVTQ
jgi:CubicO group peptidase (beta-lactamase class C family)